MKIIHHSRPRVPYFFSLLPAQWLWAQPTDGDGDGTFWGSDWHFLVHRHESLASALARGRGEPIPAGPDVVHSSVPQASMWRPRHPISWAAACCQCQLESCELQLREALSSLVFPGQLASETSPQGCHVRRQERGLPFSWAQLRQGNVR
ncbi:hypothetical protein EDB81DRAFT_109062 [Dactylonectria macrodidyma]|uniref:Uncharacterized protein n=1 Tax=Dactylonectria macrodidyma TaxID=307937 RepID=A0A9P9EAJ8_9HYPO|nr:hypothetical protein EDB81DRAFT_109062 [Dactylonectria macrodidyma]